MTEVCPQVVGPRGDTSGQASQDHSTAPQDAPLARLEAPLAPSDPIPDLSTHVARLRALEASLGPARGTVVLGEVFHPGWSVPEPQPEVSLGTVVLIAFEGASEACECCGDPYPSECACAIGECPPEECLLEEVSEPRYPWEPDDEEGGE